MENLMPSLIDVMCVCDGYPDLVALWHMDCLGRSSCHSDRLRSSADIGDSWGWADHRRLRSHRRQIDPGQLRVCHTMEQANTSMGQTRESIRHEA